MLCRNGGYDQIFGSKGATRKLLIYIILDLELFLLQRLKAQWNIRTE